MAQHVMEYRREQCRRELAERAKRVGPHRYIPGMPSVLLPVMQRAVQRVQERRHG